jgi:hypothetical protein
MDRRLLVFVLLIGVALPVVGQIREEVGSAPEGVTVPTRDPGTVWQAPALVVWDNGPLVTHPGAGAGGADESTVQNTSLGMTTLGAANQGSSGNRMADDFTVPAGEGWHINTITFFNYQTGSPTTSTFTAANLQIWEGRPGDVGSTIVWGDLVTDVMSATAWINAYRVAETTPGDTLRPIMSVEVTVGADFAPGTYWVDYQPFGSASYSGPWAPPVTILGQTTTGNARQYFSGAWQDFLDGGTAAPQGLPFVIDAQAQQLEQIPTLSSLGTALMVVTLLGVALLMVRRLA